MKWLSHPFIVLIFTLLAVLFYYSLTKSTQKSALSREYVKELAQQVDSLEGETKKIEQQLAEANTPLSEEKRIRNQLLLKKPGEYTVQLVNDPRKNAPAPPIEVTQTPLEAWKKLIF